MAPDGVQTTGAFVLIVERRREICCQNRAFFEESMKLCTSVLWYLKIIKKFARPGGRHIDFQYGAKMTLVLPISPVLLHLGPTF